MIKESWFAKKPQNFWNFEIFENQYQRKKNQNDKKNQNFVKKTSKFLGF